MKKDERRKPRILLVDNFDSFTFTIADYFLQLGAQVEVLDRERVSPEKFQDFDGIVFSPGPGNPVEMPHLLNLIKAAISMKPTFGICLGFQAIAYVFNANVEKGRPMHGKVSLINHCQPGHWLLEGLDDSFTVVRYHSLVVRSVSAPLVSLAFTQGGECMALAHNNLPVAAVQYHPEAHLTRFGFEVLNNWLKFC